MFEHPTSTSRAVLTRRGLIGLGGLVAASSLTACSSDPSASGKSSSGPARSPGSPATSATTTATADAKLSPLEALDRLAAGNARFARGEATHPNQGVDTREAVAEHQHPWALIHGCVDSRVSPELVFDQGVGDVFTTRTAGAILDDTIVGSMEFAVGSPYEIPLIVILGHTSCGAVTGTVEAVQANPGSPRAPGEVIDIVNEIAPVVSRVEPNPDKAAFIDEVVRANTLAVADGLVRRSRIIRKAVGSGRTRVLPAVYDLSSGVVIWQDETG